MKRVFLAIALTIGLGVSNAQDIKFGAKAGLNIANISNAEIEGVKLDSRIAYHLGAMAEIKWTDEFAVQPELLYSAQGASKEKEGVTATVKVDYINIPVMAKYFVMDGLSLEAGPQLGILTTAKLTIEGEGIDESEDAKDKISSIDFGLDFGASYTLDFGLNLGIRYNLGLTDLAKERERGDAIKNGVLQFSVGYFF